MTSVAAALRQHAPDYLSKFGQRLPLPKRKVLSAITRCRTGELGQVVYRCRRCERRHWIGRSCGNRHCPNCQKSKTQRWLQRQTRRLLPVPHFVVTFTVPQELREFVRAHPRAGYNALFQAGSETIRTLLADRRFLGSSQTGFFGVLHTWGRDLRVFHPHVHFVVPAGGVSPDGKRWIQTRPDRLFHPLPAKRLYKRLFVEAIRQASLYDSLPRGILKQDWVVHLQPVGNGSAVLKYLAPYIYRVAICDNRIEQITEKTVRFRVKPTGSRKWVSREAGGEQFVRAFLQHVLPPGFQKVRYYGWMSPNNRLKLERVRWLVWLHHGWTWWLGTPPIEPAPDRTIAPQCPDCGGELQLLQVTDEQGRLLHGAPLPPRAPPPVPA